MADKAPIGVGVIGLGFMGRTHLAAYQAAALAGWPCQVRAVCDGNPSRLEVSSSVGGNLDNAGSSLTIDPANVQAYREVDAILSDSRVQLVSICTYTDSHVELALRALESGKHVLVEKPVALRSEEVKRLRDAAEKSDRRCMPAMCMRFWPGWDWLHDRIIDGSPGRVRSAAFTRLGSGPGWAADFYRDVSRSGGALFDLHIHDADFIYWCFGRPAQVSATGSIGHLTTIYQGLDRTPHVTAEGGWALAPSEAFRMRFVVEFEHATADFDLMRNPPLLVHHPNRIENVQLSQGTGYDREIRHLLDCVLHPTRKMRATLEDAFEVTRMLEAEQASLEQRQPVTIRSASAG